MTDLLVSGLTIIRNGVKLDYPFMEAIRSVLPICDEYVVVVGDSEDETLEQLHSLADPRLRIVESHWSHWVRPAKHLLAQQTNLGLGHCRGRWCLYLQANEVVHEDSLPHLRQLMEEHADNLEVEALLLERLTLWSDYRTYLPLYPRRYKYSARIVRNHVGIYSIRDGMSFAVFDDFSTHGRTPRAIDSGEDLYRYGFVHSTSQQEIKFSQAVHSTGRGDQVGEQYYQEFYPRQFLASYDGPHPSVMSDRIHQWPQDRVLDLDLCRTQMTFAEKKRLFENWIYSHYGLPKWRDRRYQLIGEFAPKERIKTGLFSGTLV